MTSSPFLNPNVLQAKCRPAVQFDTNEENFELVNFENSYSNF